MSLAVCIRNDEGALNQFYCQITHLDIKTSYTKHFKVISIFPEQYNFSLAVYFLTFDGGILNELLESSPVPRSIFSTLPLLMSDSEDFMCVIDDERPFRTGILLGLGFTSMGDVYSENSSFILKDDGYYKEC